MLETTFAAVSAERVRQVCGEEPGWFCRNVLDWTDNDTLADAADFLIGKPIKILLILVLAFVVNRIARRGMKRALRTLQSGAVQERLGSLRAATPDALLRTNEHSLRAEQRTEPSLVDAAEQARLAARVHATPSGGATRSRRFLRSQASAVSPVATDTICEVESEPPNQVPRTASPRKCSIAKRVIE